MSDVPIFVHMSLPAIWKTQKSWNLDLLSSAELLQWRSDETEFRSKDNIEISALTVNKASKQAKRGECLPCERLVQGIKEACGKESSASTALYRTFTISKINLNIQYFYVIEIWKSEV